MEESNGFIIAAIVIYFGILLYSLIKSKDETTSFSGFSVSTRQYPFFIIAIVMAVTMVGPADVLALSQNGYQYGLIWALFPLGAALAQFISGTFFVEKIKEQFPAIQTPGDIFNARSSKDTAVWVGVITFIQAIAFSGVLILAGGQVLETFLGINKSVGMILTTIIVSGYTSIGGFAAVMKTDKVQAAFMGGMIVLLLISCFALGTNYSYDSTAIFKKSAFALDYPVTSIISLFCGYLFGEMLLPAYVIRARVSETGKSAKRGFLLTSLILAVWYILITLTGSMGEVLPNNLTSEAGNSVIFDAARHLFPQGSLSWNLISAFLFLAMLSLIHSTFDSFLHTGAVSFSKDVLGSITKLKDKHYLWLARQLSLGIAVLGLFIAMWVDDLIDILFIGYSVWVPSVLPQFAWIILAKGRSMPRKIFWSASIAGLVAYFAVGKYFSDYFPAILAGLLCNAIVLIILNRISTTPVTQE